MAVRPTPGSLPTVWSYRLFIRFVMHIIRSALVTSTVDTVTSSTVHSVVSVIWLMRPVTH
jgi:hypothetical protein